VEKKSPDDEVLSRHIAAAIRPYEGLLSEREVFLLIGLLESIVLSHPTLRVRAMRLAAANQTLRLDEMLGDADPSREEVPTVRISVLRPTAKPKAST
jgi:hypothetical protein